MNRPAPICVLVLTSLLLRCSSGEKLGDVSNAAPEKNGANSGANGSLSDFVPPFPGAGVGDANDPLVGGKLCDYVPHQGEKGAVSVTDCYNGTDTTELEATIELVLECVDNKDTVHLRLTFDPNFADNSYGANAIGWTGEKGPADVAGPGKKGPADVAGPGNKGHTFQDLVKSDHAQLTLTNRDGKVAVQFKLDYISENPSAPSGYASLGVSGGEGKMMVGAAKAIVKYSTSIDENLNKRGYKQYTTDSPATDSSYTPNSKAPEWDYRVVYEAWVDVTAFGPKGFGDATIESVHASPSKALDDTLKVKRDKCPPCVPGLDVNCDSQDLPDASVSDGCVPGLDTPCDQPGLDSSTPDSSYCISHPDDPDCVVF